MNKLTLILGGARSGKSTYALGLAGEKSKKVAFIATGEAKDREMEKRIAVHKKSRPPHWKTFEEAKDIAPILAQIGNSFEVIILDCLTLLVANLQLAGDDLKAIEKKINTALKAARKIKAHVIIVSNEVGSGIVPVNPLARDFRDTAGKINQLAAQACDEVFFMVSGLPLKVK